MLKPLPMSLTYEDGIMPLARKLGELAGRSPNHPRDGVLELEPVHTRPVRLNPSAWGFKSQAEMDAAFELPEIALHESRGR